MSLLIASRCEAAPDTQLSGQEFAWDWLAAQMAMPVLLATPAQKPSAVILPASQLGGMQLVRLVGSLGPDRVRTDIFERSTHARARNYRGTLALHGGTLAYAPDAVVYPQNSGDTQAVIAFAAHNDFNIVPWGNGNSGIDCSRERTIVVDLSRMSQANSRSDRFEAGRCGFEIRNSLQASGRRPMISSPDFDCATLGGWIASESKGEAASWLRSATLATPQGLIDIDEPELCRLLIGSRGALGIVTEAMIRTRTLPETRETRCFLFRNAAAGIEALQQIASEQAVETRAALSDGRQADFWRAFSSRREHWGAWLGSMYRDAWGFDGRSPMLSVTHLGSQQHVDSAITRAEIHAANLGALPLKFQPGRLRPSLRWLRPILLERSVGAEEFKFDVKWQKVAAFRRMLIAALKDMPADIAPYPGARGLAFTSVEAASADMAKLTLTYIFPRLLGEEARQFEHIEGIIAELENPPPSSENRKMQPIKAVLDPGNVLPAV